jgi:nucleotide-binding universal stress UspA family protein
MMVVPYTILQFLDSSVHSAAAVDLIAALPLPAGSEVVLLAADGESLQPGRPLSLVAQGRARLTLEQCGLRVSGPFLPGDGARRWRSMAEDLQPDLVVIGANQLRPKDGRSSRWIAHQVIEQSQWPVLVARAPFQGLKQILLAVDGSASSRSAVEFLAGFAHRAGADLRVLHVVAPEPMAAITVPGWPTGARLVPPGPSLAGIAAWDRRQKTERDEKAQAIVTEAVEVLKAAGLRARGRVVYGEVAEAILRCTRTQKIDLTVVGARGLGPVRGWLLGSVSRRLVQQARGSVLVVR